MQFYPELLKVARARGMIKSGVKVDWQNYARSKRHVLSGGGPCLFQSQHFHRIPGGIV